MDPRSSSSSKCCPGEPLKRSGHPPNRIAARRSRLAMSLAAALAGGSVFGACEARLKDAVVNGSKDYLAALLDPTLVLELLLDGSAEQDNEAGE